MGSFVVLSLVFGLIERAFPDRPQRFWRRGLLTDVAYWLITPLVTRGITRTAVIVSVVALALLGGASRERRFPRVCLDSWRGL